MKLMIAVVFLAACVACTDQGSSVTGPTAVSPGRLASCNGNPPGQQPSGNPAQAPGNSSSNDHDCKN